MLLGSFIFFMIVFAVIGCMAITKSGKNTMDYLVAGRSLPPWLVGLSAVATNNSGFMFIGMIGFTYDSGLITVWFMIGWILGDFIGLTSVLKPVVDSSHKLDSRSLGSLMSNWIGKKPFKHYGKISGLITVLFLIVYSAAQFKAGSKSLDAIFHIDRTVTILIAAGIVLLYCFSGGIRASIWTDAAQSAVMIIGMLVLAIIGFTNYDNNIQADIPDEFFNLVPGYKAVLFTLLGAMGGGFMVTGQPHIISRFLTLDTKREYRSLIKYYYFWFIAFYILTVTVGVFCRFLLDTSVEFDAEMALPRLALSYLPDVGVGLILAAIFAATISTADSLILACTAAIDEEFNNKHEESLAFTKTVTLSVLAVAIGIALMNSDTIFDMVLDAWAMLGVSFTPLIFARCFHVKVSETVAVITSFLGLMLFVVINKSSDFLEKGSSLLNFFDNLNLYYGIMPISIIILMISIIWIAGDRTSPETEHDEPSPN